MSEGVSEHAVLCVRVNAFVRMSVCVCVYKSELCSSWMAAEKCGHTCTFEVYTHV